MKNTLLSAPRQQCYKLKLYVVNIIRAKRVSNCYIQEKKKLTVCVDVCVDVRICFGFSVEKIVLVLV